MKQPVRRVTITKGFKMGRTEVTQGSVVCRNGESCPVNKEMDQINPLSNVSWDMMCRST